jgi:hypothetical protein
MVVVATTSRRDNKDQMIRPQIRSPPHQFTRFVALKMSKVSQTFSNAVWILKQASYGQKIQFVAILRNFSSGN